METAEHLALQLVTSVLEEMSEARSDALLDDIQALSEAERREVLWHLACCTATQVTVAAEGTPQSALDRWQVFVNQRAISGIDGPDPEG